jgi:hypothetical protein
VVISAFLSLKRDRDAVAGVEAVGGIIYIEEIITMEKNFAIIVVSDNKFSVSVNIRNALALIGFGVVG